MTEQKRPYREKLYHVEEEDMQQLITEAKAGRDTSQIQLLEIFGNFLAKYVALLYHGKWTTDNYDTRRFVALFVKDPQLRYSLLRNRMSRHAYGRVVETVRGVQYMVQRYGDEEDIEQTVRVTFLQCVERYKKTGDIPFSGYIYSYFFYLLKRNVDAFLIDQLGRKTFPLVTDEMDDDEQPEGFTAPPEPSVEELIYSEEIDEYWVLGDTAHPPFDALTVQERQLLKWRYINGERSSDIAHRITEHPNTVREHFNRIKLRLREVIAEQLEED